MNCQAYKSEHNYHIIGNSYNYKEKFKAVKGQWNPEKKQWILPKTVDALALIRELKIPFRVKVWHDTFCHEDEGIWYLGEDEFKDGYTTKTQFCGYCDSHYRDSVAIKVIEE